MGFWRSPDALFCDYADVVGYLWHKLWVYGGFPMTTIKFIAFARYPPRPDTSQDGGLVGLHETRQLRVLYS
jgi:hypothetical protein